MKNGYYMGVEYEDLLYALEKGYTVFGTVDGEPVIMQKKGKHIKASGPTFSCKFQTGENFLKDCYAANIEFIDLSIPRTKY